MERACESCSRAIEPCQPQLLFAPAVSCVYPECSATSLTSQHPVDSTTLQDFGFLSSSGWFCPWWLKVSSRGVVTSDRGAVTASGEFAMSLATTSVYKVNNLAWPHSWDCQCFHVDKLCICMVYRKTFNFNGFSFAFFFFPTAYFLLKEKSTLM